MIRKKLFTALQGLIIFLSFLGPALVYGYGDSDRDSICNCDFRKTMKNKLENSWVILKNSSGETKTMTLFRALGLVSVKNADGTSGWEKEREDVCKPFDGHVPSIRELAEIAQEKGAKGIFESRVKGYAQINALNLNNVEDKFYFNHTGFRRGILGSQNIWSSSLKLPIEDRKAFSLGESGVILDSFAESGKGAVMCIFDQPLSK